jgi:hypothetical protein
VPLGSLCGPRRSALHSNQRRAAFIGLMPPVVAIDCDGLEIRVSARMTQEKRASPGEPARYWVGLLRRRDGGDGLQAEGNDLGTDRFARDDQLDAAVLLATLGSIV